ncbi:TonB-dependent receptor [Stakelama sediminis]|uniref:Iron complex outermembrane receptor protein n=1 Tax=Stakelama sediminis TaxID=463200 RepID=A0A840YY41_9SPHN|nr:TonB-dependent receptor [Stakelama sediminis]MBB5718444.1 iron complex outermembrane receptor protein [Stakelama sediminis]
MFQTPINLRKTAIIGTVSALALASSMPVHAQDVKSSNSSTSQKSTPSGQSSDQTYGSTADQSKDIVVTGIRAALETALEAKRNANAIIDSVSAEDVGKFPNTNVAEALTLVPGVTVDRQFGQGEKVSILGTDPALNRTLLNGQTVASADWFILDSPGRTFNYALLAPQLVDRVDVYKSPEAKIDEGSIGGTVNVITRRPLDMKPFTVAGSLGYLYNDRSKKGDIEGSALVAWHNPSDTLGVLVSFQRWKDRLRRDGLESYGTIPADFWNGNNDGGISSITTGNCTGDCATTLLNNPDAVFPNSFGTSYFEQGRERKTYSATLQWKPVDKLTLTADWLRVDANYDNFNQSQYSFAGNTWNSAGALTGLTVKDGIVASASFHNALSVYDAQYRVAEMHSQTFHGKAFWDDDDWSLSVEGGTSNADGGTKHQVFLEFLNWSDYTVDISGAPKVPGTISYPTDVLGDPSAFATDPGWSGNLVDKPTQDKERYAQGDLTLKFHSSLKSIQIGYKWRHHETSEQYAGVTIAGVSAPTSLFDPSQVNSNYLSGFDGLNDQMTGRFKISGASMVDYVEGGSWLPAGTAFPVPSKFAAAEFTAGNWDVREDINAAYVQANFEQGALRGNIGVRYVDTHSASAGYVCNPGAPCNSEGDWSWQTTKKHYQNVLPAVNVAINLEPNLIFRFAGSEVIARPNYADMTSYFWLSDQILTGGGGNPELNPYEATNYDASLEWYFSPRSILSAELFYKDIGNYILNETRPEDYYNQSQGEVTTYQISRPYNAGSATSRGFAVAYQQVLPFGFGILANYTYSDAHGRDNAPLPYNSKHQVSVSPYFERGPVSVRGTYTWRSKYFTGIDRGDNLFVRDSANVDVSATYNFTKYLGVTLSGMNLTDSTYYSYANTPLLPRGVYKSGRKFMATINVNF